MLHDEEAWMKAEGNMTNKRVEWLDIAKFLGIFSIYLGHLGEVSGLSCSFVNCYHVSLFFFLSGCTMTFDKSVSFLSFLKKKVKTLIIPFFSFAFLSLILMLIETNEAISDIGSYIKIIAFGCIRNTYFASSLWFLTALFVIEILFWVLRKIKFPVVVLAISLIARFAGVKIITGSPDVDLWHFFNWDCALYYLIFFAAGFYSYKILSVLFELDSKKKRIWFTVILILTAVFAALVFARKSYVMDNTSIKYLSEIISIARTLVLITFFLFLSRILSGVPLLAGLGRETLYLCGSEWIIRTLFHNFLCVFGFGTELFGVLVAYAHSFVLIVVGAKILIPFEKAVRDAVAGSLFPSKKDA